MHVHNLDPARLLELRVDAGLVYFAGHRALVLDAVAVGLLRKYLIDHLGDAEAARVLTGFGFAHGWRMADAMKREMTWDDDAEGGVHAWRHLGAVQGLFSVAQGSGSASDAQEASLIASFEAEQHLLYFSRSNAPVCAIVSGIASGYVSNIQNEEVCFLEDSCVGCGDASCHIVGMTRAAWAGNRAAELVRYDGALATTLQHVPSTLEPAETTLYRPLDRVSRERLEQSGIVARSLEMQRVVDLACRVAKVDATILITGESGVGKERIARLVHDESLRSEESFVAVNCGAIAETLLESELFGHARGAFTGASSDRVGLFESASGGTLLLDEVGEVSPALQVKLLRVLQERELRRVGENRSRKFDVRVLAATNRDLIARIDGGHFRQDLYYRLKVVEIHLPPLRDRIVDILPLAQALLHVIAHRAGRTVDRLSPEVATLLVRYGWPGNVRELENTMERAVALSRGPCVEVDVLPDEIRHARRAIHTPDVSVCTLEDMERDYILAALAKNGGNQTATARQLEIGTATLYRKLRKWRHEGRQTR